MPSYPAPPFFDPSLNAGFVTGRGTGGGVTYGDPEIGGRPPRYQNWNAGFQYALARTLTVGATYAGSRGDFLGGSGRGFFSNQLDPRFLALGNLLTQQATPANIAAAQAIVLRRRPAVSELLGHHRADAAAVSAVLGRDRRLRQRRGSTYHSLQLTAEKRRSDDGLTVNFNYTFSRTEDNLAARTGYDFDQDWAVGVNDQPHVWNAMVVYNLPFGADGKPGSGNPIVRAIVKDWQVSGITQFRSGRPLGVIGAACNLPSAGGCYADFNPNFTGDVRINGDYGDGDVLGTNPPSYIDRAAFQSPAAFTFGNTPRTLAHDLRNPQLLQPGSQRAAGLPDLQGEARARRRRVQPVQQRDLRRDPDEHHERELRQGQLTGQHAARRADQGAAGVLNRRTGEQEVRKATENSPNSYPPVQDS